MAQLYVFKRLWGFIIIVLLLVADYCDSKSTSDHETSPRRLRKFSGRRPNDKFLKSAMSKNLVLNENKTNGDVANSNSTSEQFVNIDSEATISKDWVVNASYNVIYTENVSKDNSWTFKYPPAPMNEEVSRIILLYIVGLQCTSLFIYVFLVVDRRRSRRTHHMVMPRGRTRLKLSKTESTTTSSSWAPTCWALALAWELPRVANEIARADDF